MYQDLSELSYFVYSGKNSNLKFQIINRIFKREYFSSFFYCKIIYNKIKKYEIAIRIFENHIYLW